MILWVIFNGDFERKIFASTGIRSLDLPTHLFWRWESAILLAFLRLCGEPPFRQNFKLKCYWRQHVAKQIIVIALVGTKEGLMQKKIQKTSFDAICWKMRLFANEKTLQWVLVGKVCECVCVRERERENESSCLVCSWVRCVCVCVYVRA